MHTNDPSKNRQGLNRRQFIQTSATLAGTALLSPWALTNVHKRCPSAPPRTW